MPRRLTARPCPAWVGDRPVYEQTLANGLKALVLPRPTAPVVVCDLFYPVGSVDEPPGKSGLAHFVEHMLFKGTPRLPKGQVDRLAFAAGGQSNAETGEDDTHYWFAFPRDRWELALAIEADRMMGARFDPAEVEAERHVIAEERARDLDSPLGRLDQAHMALSYRVHPYRNPVLGWPEDLERITREDLRRFYRQHYRPDGAVLVVVGDIDPQHAFDRIAYHFAPIPTGPARRRRRPIPVEPPQRRRREVMLVEADGVVRGLLGWHSVARSHGDTAALGVLADLLACGRRSRLWDRLVECDRLATWVDASQESSRLAGQFLVQIEAVSGADPRELEAIVREEIEELAEDGPDADELVRCRRRLEASWRWEQEDLGGLAAGIGPLALRGDWRTWLDEHRQALRVTAGDIRRVAGAYFRRSGLTAGWSLPRAESGLVLAVAAAAVRESTAPRPPAPSAGEAPLALQIPASQAALPEYRPRRRRLANGLRLVTECRPGTGTVAIELYCDAGQLREAKPGLAHLTGRLLEEGTERRSAEELAEAIEDVGGSLETSATGVSLRVRAEDLALAVDLLADVVRRPAFPAKALGWARNRTIAERRGDLEAPAYKAELLFRRLAYGPGPMGVDPRGRPSEVRALMREDVVDHHRRHFIPSRSILSVVGDFNSAELNRVVRHHFGDWTGTHENPSWMHVLAPPQRRVRRRVVQPGEQVHLLLGHLGITRTDRDFPALCVLDQIFGSGPGFTDRLSRVVRDELGLAYAVSGGCTDSADLMPGLFRVYIGTGPAEAERAAAVAIDQIHAMHEGRFSDDEVEAARRFLAAAWVFDFQTVSQRAELLLDLERLGLPLSDPLRWPDRMDRITPDAVRRAARRHLHPDRLVQVAYGPWRRR